MCRIHLIEIEKRQRERESDDIRTKSMSMTVDRIENDGDRPMTYSINIKTLSTPGRPLTCCITATSTISKQRVTSESIRRQPTWYREEKPSSRVNITKVERPSSIQLPVTYSTSIYVPCRSRAVSTRPPPLVPPPTFHHHYHYHHHHHHDPSTNIKPNLSPRLVSTGSNRPAAVSTTTTTSSPDSPSPSKEPSRIVSSSQTNTRSHRPDRHRSAHPHSLPSYSALVWNWFHHTPTKPFTDRKGSQSDYSEVCRHETLNRRSLLYKLVTSIVDRPAEFKPHRPCFTRKRLESSSST